MLRPCLILFFSIAAFSCGEDDSTEPPEGVTCSAIAKAADPDELAKSLANAAAGSCVVVSGTVTTPNPVAVGAGVILVGARGGGAINVTDLDAPAAITLANDAQLGHITIASPPRSGVLVEGANARLFSMTVTGAASSAVAATAAARLENVTLQKNGYGLYAQGENAHVAVTGGRIAENGGTSLSAGAGVVAIEGASVELDGVTVEKNQGTGVLADGAATKLLIKSSSILDNHERGIWAQGLDGSIDSPSLRIENAQVLRNRIVGVGGIETRGIIIVGGKVAETIASPVPTNLATTEPIGDGLGLFGGTTDVKVEETSFEANERAAGIVDGSEVGIIIVGGNVSAGGSGLKFVVQNTKAEVQIPDGDKSVPEKALGISAPKIKIPVAH